MLNLDYFKTTPITSPIALTELCADIMVDQSLYLEHFLKHFGLKLFQTHQIPKRINFLYKKHRKDLDLMDRVRFESKSDVICLSDLHGDFGRTMIMLLRDKNDYSIRTWNENNFDQILGKPQKDALFSRTSEFQYKFWNFDEEQINEPSHGFFDIYKTKRVCNMIIWATNIFDIIL